MRPIRLTNDPNSRDMDDRLYANMRDSLLASTPASPEGATFAEICQGAATRIDRALFDRPVLIRWYAKAVHVDLETRWLIERIPGSNPARFRRTR